MTECLLAVRVQCKSRGQRAAESRFVVRREEFGGKRGRSELGRGGWHRTGGHSSRGVPNRCTEGTRGELIRFHAFKLAETWRYRTIFVMVDPNFQATNVRWSGTPRAAAVDLEVPTGAT